MSQRSPPLDELRIPDGTTVEEHDLVTDRDVIVGGRSVVDFGVRGEAVIAGEGTEFGGNIEAAGDCRLDMWTEVAGNVLVGQDAYLGERVHVEGELRVAGDLDVGDDVEIEEGFEANGWIVIRNPMPTMVFLFVYLTYLLQTGGDEPIEELLDEDIEEAEADADVDPDSLVIPRGAHIGDETWEIPTPAWIGDDCRLHGNVRATSIELGEDSELFGSLRARGDVTIGSGTCVHGNVTARGGTARLEGDARVLGDVTCNDLDVSAQSTVEGTMRASGEVDIETVPSSQDDDS